ncbi:NmrA family transcriptional regulator [Streptomyces oceani]|uniref:NmrA family transcriptional regulator n=1 Tax=Streptomyces oceani TaxID=1075402 RepID=A0A1E7KF36_9ACTN|nr:NmrA family transcriptional regulator [Streptomyces oceani]OEV02531.1 NmrA family transcriptional regulator [Streptomyces oceani]
MTSTARTTLVLAGTGKTGRRVASGLAACDRPVRIGSRRADPPFDWQDDTTWEPALRGTDAAYVAFYPDAAFPGAARVVGSFANLAVSCGVRRLVLLADRGAEEAERCEQAVRDSGAEWTVVRAGFITQNFSEAFLVELVRAGVVALPAGEVTEPFTDARDIADVALAALTENGHAGRIHDVTGPRLFTFADAVGEIARTTRGEVRYLPVTPEQFVSSLIGRGVSAEYAGQLAGLMVEVFDGRRSHVTDTVERILGRPPRDFAEYAHETAATGVWDARAAPPGGV